jgi:hypothetical protein
MEETVGPMMRRVVFVVLIACTVSVWKARTDQDVVVAQRRAPVVVTRIFTGPDGLTHAEEITAKLAPGGGFTGGKKIPIGPGHILLAEDVTGKGHISRGVGTEDRISLFIPLAE